MELFFSIFIPFKVINNNSKRWDGRQDAENKEGNTHTELPSQQATKVDAQMVSCTEKMTIWEMKGGRRREGRYMEREGKVASTMTRMIQVVSLSTLILNSKTGPLGLAIGALVFGRVTDLMDTQS